VARRSLRTIEPHAAAGHAGWIAKIGLVVEEADETVFWLEMLSDCGIVPSQRCEDILKEAHELSAIFTASQHTAKRAG
jgi:four helix bundle protein